MPAWDELVAFLRGLPEEDVAGLYALYRVGDRPYATPPEAMRAFRCSFELAMNPMHREHGADDLAANGPLATGSAAAASGSGCGSTRGRSTSSATTRQRPPERTNRWQESQYSLPDQRRRRPALLQVHKAACNLVMIAATHPDTELAVKAATALGDLGAGGSPGGHGHRAIPWAQRRLLMVHQLRDIPPVLGLDVSLVLTRVMTSDPSEEVRAAAEEASGILRLLAREVQTAGASGSRPVQDPCRGRRDGDSMTEDEHAGFAGALVES